MSDAEKPVLIVLHQENSTPGRVGHALRARGYRLDVRRPPLGEALPDEMDQHAGVVIFGGPMSANDPEPWVEAEMACIGKTLEAGTPFLGLCLGAQLLCRLLGGKVAAHTDGQVEIGYYPILPTPDGEAFAKRLGAPWPRHVYHWHREGFELPQGAVRMAGGETFPQQAFRYGRNAYGLQFHPEVTYAMMCRWTVNSYDRMQHPGARMPSEHLSGWYQHDYDVRNWLDAFLDHWLANDVQIDQTGTN